MMAKNRLSYTHFKTSVSIDFIECFMKFIHIYHIIIASFLKSKVEKACSREKRKYIELLHLNIDRYFDVITINPLLIHRSSLIYEIIYIIVYYGRSLSALESD